MTVDLNKFINKFDSSLVTHEYKSCWFLLGMGRYEKYVHWEVANAKPYRIRDSAF